jgi:hypothetical protein
VVLEFALNKKTKIDAEAISKKFTCRLIFPLLEISSASFFQIRQQNRKLDVLREHKANIWPGVQQQQKTAPY